MKQVFSILTWLPVYKRQWLGKDLSAGLTVGVLLIPQGMAYAMIAGLPPVYGLYAAFIPQVLYAIFGTSRQLSVGPVAIDSILVASGIGAIASVGTEDYVQVALLLALLVGIIQLLFGILKMGFIANFLSKPVISGFTSAAAIIIAASQLHHFTGIRVEESENLWSTIEGVRANLLDAHFLPLILGFGTIVVLIVLKSLHKSIPGGLVVIISAVLITWSFDLAGKGLVIVGEVPVGLPAFTFHFSMSQVYDLIPIAFTLAIIGYTEAISIGKSMRDMHNREYEIDSNQEFIALGASNFIGSFFGSYPVTGGFGRSAVNNEAGAKTNLASIVSAVLVGLTLLFLTPLFYYLPNAILGGIIIVAVSGLVDLKYAKYLFKVKKEDFWLMLATFLITLVVGIKEGVIVGVLLSLVMLVYRTSKPHFAILGRLPGTKDFRNVSRFDQIEVRPDILVVRQDAQLYYANTGHFLERLNAAVAQKGAPLKLVILHCGSISNVDSTALEDLKMCIAQLQERQVAFFFSGLIGPVRDFFKREGFMEELGADHFYIDVESAIKHFDGLDGPKAFKKNQWATQSNVFGDRTV